MRRVYGNEFNFIQVYQSGYSSDSSHSGYVAEIRLTEDKEESLPDFSQMFQSALQKLPV